MEFPDDAGLRTVLTKFGVQPHHYLGHGGEAWVYALDAERVLRVLHAGEDPTALRARQALVDELATGDARFALPQLLDVGAVQDRWYAIERRLRGISALQQLGRLDGAERDALIENHMHTCAQLAELPLQPRGWFGDLIRDDAVRTATWKGYLRERVAKRLGGAPPEFHHIDAAALADALPDASSAAFVHLDAFLGNMLAVDSTITAVIDIGRPAVAGDPRFDTVLAAVYIASPNITPVATARDVDIAMDWLRDTGLVDMYEPTRRWIAAYWSHAYDDTNLLQWCRSVLLH